MDVDAISQALGEEVNGVGIIGKRAIVIKRD